MNFMINQEIEKTGQFRLPRSVQRPKVAFI
jgi:hypothetical protein